MLQLPHSPVKPVPGHQLTLYPFRLTAGNAAEILAGYDFVIDATDNFDSKFLIARA